MSLPSPTLGPVPGYSLSLRLEDHVFRIMDNQFRMMAELGPCDWNLNMQTESLSFLVDGGHTVLAEVPAHLVGNRDESANTWQWSWASPQNTINPRMVRGAAQLRALAAETPEVPPYLLDEREFPVPFGEFGTAMAVLVAGISRGFGFYKCPYAGGEEYVVVDRFPAALAIPADAHRTIRAMMSACATLPFDHKTAVEAFLKRADIAGTYSLPGSGKRVIIHYDPQDRIQSIELAPQTAAEVAAAKNTGIFGRFFGRRSG